MRRAAKVDANQAFIVAALRDIGATVQPLHMVGHKVCISCGGAYHSYNKTRKYCSHQCYAKTTVVRQKAQCGFCGKEFRKHVKKSKYCSAECSKASRPKTVFYVPKPRTVATIECGYCKVTVSVSPSRKRKFCSYSCHLESGGAKRAGQAAVEAKMKYGAKKDANHSEIFDAISRFAAVKDLSNAGMGIPDGLAWVKGAWHLFDVKNPKTGYGKRGLNKVQKKWAEDWRGGPVYLIYTVEEAIMFARGNFEGLSRFPTVETVGAALAVIGAIDMPIAGKIT